MQVPYAMHMLQHTHAEYHQFYNNSYSSHCKLYFCNKKWKEDIEESVSFVFVQVA